MDPVSPQSDDSPLTKYRTEAEHIAGFLMEYSQKNISLVLSEAALQSSESVSRVIADLDKSSREALTHLTSENAELKAMLLSLSSKAASAVTQAMTPKLAVSTAGAIPAFPAIDAASNTLQKENESVVEELSSVIASLAAENATLRGEVVRLESTSIPAEWLHSLHAGGTAMTESVLAECDAVDHQLIALAAACSADAHPHSTTSTMRSEDGAEPCSAGVHEFRLVRHESLWEDAIRELDEKALFVANQQRSMAEVEKQQQERILLENRLRLAEEKVEASQALAKALEGDVAALTFRNNTLVAQMASLLEASQTLATQVALLQRSVPAAGAGTPPHSTGEGHRLSVSSFNGSFDTEWKLNTAAVQALSGSGSETPFASAMKTLQKAQSMVRDDLNRTLDAPSSILTPLRSRLNASGSTKPLAAHHSNSAVVNQSQIQQAASIHPAQPVHTVMDVDSIETLVRTNQDLVGKNHTLVLEQVQLLAKVRMLELMVPAGSDNSRAEDEGHGYAVDRKRLRQQHTVCVSDTHPRLVETGTMTSIISELESVQLTTSSGLVNAPAPMSVAPSASAAELTCCWTLMHQLSEIIGDFIQRTSQSLDDAGSESVRKSTADLVRSTVQMHKRALVAERQLEVVQAACEEAQAELNSRSLVPASVLQGVHDTVAAALAAMNASRLKCSEGNLTSPSAQGERDLDAGAMGTVWNEWLSLLQSATAKERVLMQLIHQIPTKRDFSSEVAVAEDAEMKLRVAESTVEELTTQLAQERERCLRHLGSLHQEKMKHMATMERMWMAERAADSLRDSLTALQHQTGVMYTQAQYDEVVAKMECATVAVAEAMDKLGEARNVAVQLEAARDEAAVAVETARGELQTAQRQWQQERESFNSQLQDATAQLQYQLSALQEVQSNAFHVSQQNSQLAQQLEFQQQFVVQLREAILSQQFTEDLLRSLYPNDSVLDAMMQRDRVLVKESAELKETVQRHESALRESRARILELDGHVATQRGLLQQSQLELQLARSSALFEGAVSTRSSIPLQLEDALRTIAELRVANDHLVQREAALEQRVADLAADPISFNVRTYGVERTRTIAEQMEQLHERCLGLEHAVSEKTKEVAAAHENLKAVNAAIEESRASNEALTKSLETSRGEHQQAVSEVAKLQEVRTSLQSQLESATKGLEASRQQLLKLQQEEAATNAKLQAITNTLDSVTADKETLYRDNLDLVQRMDELRTSMQRLGKELREAQAAAAANAAAAKAAAVQHRSFATDARSDRGRKAQPSFQQAASRDRL